MSTKLKNKPLFYLIIATIGLFSSCGSKKDVIYFQNAEKVPKELFYNDESSYQIRITSNDNLLITVSATNPQAVEVFNTINFNKTTSVSNLNWQGYLVDETGNINFPLVGKIKLGGLTKTEAITVLQKKVSEYIEDPVVNIRFMNYKVTVLGEVNRPGTYTIENEKITLPEALGLAGDMTIYGQRHDVLICRVVNGEKQFYRLDMTSPEVFFSPHFYLQQNDIVYVQPNGTKAGSSTYNQNLPLIVSLVSVVITAIALFTR